MMLDSTCDFGGTEDGLFSTEYGKGDSLDGSNGLPTACTICEKPFKDPVILSCLHIFDRDCLSKFEIQDNLASFVRCPRCDRTSGGVKTLEEYDMSVMEESDEPECCASDEKIKCSLCTEGREAQYRCLHCAGTLCDRCKDIHKVVKIFSFHEVLELTPNEKANPKMLTRAIQRSRPVTCNEHTKEDYTQFCMQCHVPLCKECYDVDHKGHITLGLNAVPKHVESLLSSGLQACQDKQLNLRNLSDKMQTILGDLSASKDQNRSHIEEVCNDWKAAVDAIKDEFLQQNRQLHDDIEMKVWSRMHQLRKKIDHIDFVSEFSKSYLQKCSTLQMSKLLKVVLGCLEYLKAVEMRADMPGKILFMDTPGVMQEIIRSHFGKFDLPHFSDFTHLNENDSPPRQPKSRLPPFDPRMASGGVSAAFKALSLRSPCALGEATTTICGHPLQRVSPTDSLASDLARGSVVSLPLENGHMPTLLSHHSNVSGWGDLPLTGIGTATSDFSSVSQVDPIFLNSSLTVSSNMQRSHSQLAAMGLDIDPASYLNKSKLPLNYNATLYEYSRQRAARCSQMTLLTRWGSLGCEIGRLNSPHGFCLGFDEEIVVADTYNHRIQIFNKRGDCVSFFGVSGRIDGLLWYPRKVAIIRQSQRYVVCDRGNERSRMQLFSRSGHFVRRIPIRYIDIVAGLAINQHGHIVAIDSVSPSVFVVSEEGDLVRWFDCSNHMREPSDVAIHGREYYICDFKAHCVIVFQEDGNFIRRIGGETITDFPNGIDVSDHGDVLVGDSHGNRFHIAVFNRTGELLSEFVCSQTKVSRSCCLKITTEGYVVTLARSSNNVLVLDTLYIC